MKNYLSESQLEKVKSFIQVELLKRGFLAPITTFKEVEGRYEKHYFELETESFQTVPVIFQEIRISNFSTGIGDEEVRVVSKVRVRPIWISVHVSYKHFDGGSNGCKLFDVIGLAQMDSNYIFDLITK